MIFFLLFFIEKIEMGLELQLEPHNIAFTNMNS